MGLGAMSRGGLQDGCWVGWVTGLDVASTVFLGHVQFRFRHFSSFFMVRIRPDCGHDLTNLVVDFSPDIEEEEDENNDEGESQSNRTSYDNDRGLCRMRWIG